MTAEGFVFDKTIDIEGGIKLGEQIAGLEQFEEHDIAEAEAKRGEVDLAAADELDEIIVAAATGDGAEFSLAGRRLRKRRRYNKRGRE